MQSGSPHLISVMRMHSRKTFRPTGFPKNNEASLVSVDRNSSMGGVVVGNLVAFLGVAMGAGLAGTELVPVSQFRRGPVLVARGGLYPRYQ